MSIKYPKATVASLKIKKKHPNTKLKNWLCRNNSANVNGILNPQCLRSGSVPPISTEIWYDSEVDEQTPRKITLISKTPPPPKHFKTSGKNCYCRQTPISLRFRTLSTSMICDDDNNRDQQRLARKCMPCLNDYKWVDIFKNYDRYPKIFNCTHEHNDSKKENKCKSKYYYDNDDNHDAATTLSSDKLNQPEVLHSDFERPHTRRVKTSNNINHLKTLKHFRDENYFDCHSVKSKYDHTCLHRFTLNDRLTVIPDNRDLYGLSLCCICNKPMNSISSKHKERSEKVSSPNKSLPIKTNKTKTSVKELSRSNLFHAEDYIPNRIHMSTENEKVEVKVPTSILNMKKVPSKSTENNYKLSTNTLALRFQKGVY